MRSSDQESLREGSGVWKNSTLSVKVTQNAGNVYWSQWLNFPGFRRIRNSTSSLSSLTTAFPDGDEVVPWPSDWRASSYMEIEREFSFSHCFTCSANWGTCWAEAARVRGRSVTGCVGVCGGETLTLTWFHPARLALRLKASKAESTPLEMCLLNRKPHFQPQSRKGGLLLSTRESSNHCQMSGSRTVPLRPTAETGLSPKTDTFKAS